jgi:YidC/Oxa1 family membrane protein insertase
MDRIQIAAIVVAVVLIVVPFFLKKPEPPPVAPSSVTEPSEPAPAPPPTADPSQAAAPVVPEPAQPRGELVTLENDALRVRVSTLGARLESVELLQYRATVAKDSPPVQLVTVSGRGAGFLFLGPEPLRSFEGAATQLETVEPRRVKLRAARDGIVVTRTLELDDAGYGAWLTVGIRNDGADVVKPKLDLVFYGQDKPADAADHFLNYNLVAYVDGSVHRVPLAGVGKAGFFGQLMGKGAPTGTAYPAPAEWAGVDSQYFLASGIPENPRESTAFLGPLGTDIGQAALGQPSFDVPPGTGVERRYRLFFGPKVPDVIASVDPRLESSIQSGWSFVRPLVRLFEVMLRWTHDHVVPNYGVAIILLTILVRIVTYPLTQRSMTSMKRFSVIAPQMKELQEKYANDRDKLQEELMKLYKQKGMNPLAAMGGGCVPMLIQMPVMIALYFALQTSMELRHAPFAFWIHDLSAPENLASIAGIPIRLLPLLMGASMMLQQRLTPAPNADPQQRQMMTLMSVVFTFMFYQFPSGLVLYWFVSNLLGIAQQLWVNRTPVEATA